jgi:hypothetical protein
MLDREPALDFSRLPISGRWRIIEKTPESVGNGRSINGALFES